MNYPCKVFNREHEMVDFNTPDNIDGVVSIFERDPFKEFTHKKFKELMHQDNMHKIIQMREQALEIRHQTQMENMKKMLENRRFSPRTFQTKQLELEKWVTKEREILQKSKKDIEKGWYSTADSIKRVGDLCEAYVENNIIRHKEICSS